MQRKLCLNRKKIFVLIFAFCCSFFFSVAQLYAGYWNGKSWVSSNDFPDSSETNDMHENSEERITAPEKKAYNVLDKEIQDSIEKLKEKESEITKRGKEIDRLEERNAEIEKELAKLEEQKPFIEYNKVPPSVMNQYREYTESSYVFSETKENLERMTKIASLLKELERNNIKLDNARKELAETVNEYQKVVEPIAQSLKNVEVAGDPVDVTNGKYVYQYSDKIFTKSYETKREGVFGKNWISNLDSRIIRCKLPDFSEEIKLLNDNVQNCENGISEINELQNYCNNFSDFQSQFESFQTELQNYNDTFEYYENDQIGSENLETFKNELNNAKDKISEFDNELNFFEQKKNDSENKIFFYEELNNLNAYIDEVNKYVTYDEFKNPDSYILMYGFIYFVDENGTSILCKLNENCYEPLNENIKNVIKIYGLEKNGEISLDGNNEGGFVVESLYGEKKYYSK